MLKIGNKVEMELDKFMVYWEIGLRIEEFLISKGILERENQNNNYYSTQGLNDMKLSDIHRLFEELKTIIDNCKKRIEETK